MGLRNSRAKLRLENNLADNLDEKTMTNNGDNRQGCPKMQSDVKSRSLEYLGHAITVQKTGKGVKSENYIIMRLYGSPICFFNYS